MIISYNKVKKIIRVIYSRFPVSDSLKWKLRERLHPVLDAINRGDPPRLLIKQTLNGFRKTSQSAHYHHTLIFEKSFLKFLKALEKHTSTHGPCKRWISLPFWGSGGAEVFASNLCEALTHLNPLESLVVLITDRPLVDVTFKHSPRVLILPLDDFLDGQISYELKKLFLEYLIRAVRPSSFHIINSEVSWSLLIEKGKILSHATRFFGSIFSVQREPTTGVKIGYASSFLKKSMPYLQALLTDNHRFLEQATVEFQLSAEEKSRVVVLDQPCRQKEAIDFGIQNLVKRREKLDHRSTSKKHRPQVLWAGRLDAEKRIDLFIEVVKKCSFADFRVYGAVVLGDGDNLPSLPNVSFHGCFASPLELIVGYDFDAFLFTSFWEGMPNILIEVAAMGIPIIAPTVGGVVDFIKEETGFPLPERPSVQDYEQALLSVIKNPSAALDRAHKLLQYVQKNHSWKKYIQDVSSLHFYFDDHTTLKEEQNIKTPKVSVIIPCFNQGKYLIESVVSALAACSFPLEIIIVDDGSTDPSIEHQLRDAKELAPDIIRIHRQKNKGLSAARNTGIALSTGELIQFLDADDLLTPGKIDHQILQMRLNPEIQVSVCNFLLCDQNVFYFFKHEEAIASFDFSLKDFLYRWERGFSIPIHCGLFRRSLLEKVSFDPDINAKEDWLFWTNLSLNKTKIAYIHGHWAVYRQHGESMRRSYVSMGHAWLQAGLKLYEKIKKQEPLFFDSVLSWFDQCYRKNSLYAKEISLLRSEEKSNISKKNKEILSMENLKGYSFLAEKEILEAFSEKSVLKNHPIFSVIIPVYNHFDYLKTCLLSVAAQDRVDFEVICVDDGSSDPRVRALMLELRDKNKRLKIRINSKNQGISAVQNWAAQNATGEWLVFLDCDDELEPDSLKRVWDELRNDPKIDYLFTDRFDIDEQGNILRTSS